MLKQSAFDALYMQRFFNDNTKTSQTLEVMIANNYLKDLDDAAIQEQRLKKNAAEYAKKTYLLFALLA